MTTNPDTTPALVRAPSYRDDPRWQAAHARYATEDFETDPDVLYVRRVDAATELKVVEAAHAEPCDYCGQAPAPLVEPDGRFCRSECVGYHRISEYTPWRRAAVSR